jgi:maltooligosyltrehalose trehalohydrolase
VLIEHTKGARSRVQLEKDAEGFFAGSLSEIHPGDRYQFLLDGDRARPDPVSRFQPEGPHGPSEVIDPLRFRWTDVTWPGIGAQGHVIYEMHVGTFTQEGTWAAAERELPELARLGITVIEMMPVADFPGRFGWGYDGVALYAPTRLYGQPDDLRAFVDRAHALGIAVILDVVYNHLGPDGNYLSEFSPHYFTDRYENDWGRAINFEGPQPARNYFIENAGYWIDEFHFDGLRLDATQDIKDASSTHVIADIVTRARATAGRRRIYIVAENEPQETRVVREPSVGGYGVDALWNDDYHHTAVVALTGRREAYYQPYVGSPQEFISGIKYGYLYQGQWYAWQKKQRGTATFDLRPHNFVSFLENHDQVANTPFGRRLHQIASPGNHRALTALTLLGPATPLLFQGQEFASSSPFLYFCDHHERLREAVREGRRGFLTQFASLSDSEVQAALPDPGDEATFQRSKLNLEERKTHSHAYSLHRDLLAIRRSDDVIAAVARASEGEPASEGRREVPRSGTPSAQRGGEAKGALPSGGILDGAVLGARAFVLRYRSRSGDRLLIVNLGGDIDLTPIPEPLLAPPEGNRWTLQWSSESIAYGGQGRAPLRTHPEWHIPGEAAVLLRPAQENEQDDVTE